MRNKSHTPEPVNWRFWAGSQDTVVYVRKHTVTTEYVISGTILPQSNVAGNAPETLNVTINLAGKKLSFEVRRQGSVYSLSTDAKGTPTKFVQLDGCECSNIKHVGATGTRLLSLFASNTAYCLQGMNLRIPRTGPQT
jgi:hypothetical protein